MGDKHGQDHQEPSLSTPQARNQGRVSSNGWTWSGGPKELTPEICAARWRYNGLNSQDLTQRSAPLTDHLIVERATSQNWMLVGVLPGAIIFGIFLYCGIYLLYVKQFLFGVVLVLFSSLPTYLLVGMTIHSILIEFYNLKFTPPRLIFNCASLVPGATVTVHYRHVQRNARRSIHGFVLTQLVMATRTVVPDTSPEQGTDARHQVLWSSGVEVHPVDANTAGMTFEQVLELPKGFPDTGPLPTEGEELGKQAVWCLCVYEVISPRSACEYQFVLPVGSAPLAPCIPQASV